ncbi:MAG: hypothetical protein KF802_09725 [Bdellovibrionaceae bacterium]|nr:hypothetical protein [Pseudobdellovibrionaceae bacterium]MBX3033603.1 hypothetical protein [Pseudobdellovibrionaceae bacterium]
MKLIVFSLCAMLAVSTVHAQTSATSNETLRSWKRGTAIVLFAGVGGGILGLSTLSFHGQPQEHTSNITTGALLGVLGGLGYVFWESNRAPAPSTWSLAVTREGDPALAYHLSF